MGQSLLLLLACLVYVWQTINAASACPRAPTHLLHGRRTRGDNGYKLIVADGPNGYVPGKTYNLLLLGSRTHSKVQHFTHFTITAEAQTGARRPQVASPRRVGRFQLFSDSLTQFNDRCVNTVSEADDLPKTEVQVMWVAPESGSGCVALSAMVYEGPRAWYADDGNLSAVMCERKPDAATAQKECCACDEAKYSFVFEGIWSNETHPKDYPFAIWLTHFSDVIGASHESNFSFWGENHIATAGFRSLAEWGSPAALETELRANGPKLRTLIKAAGLWYPNVNENTSSKFRVDRKHPKVSMVSMFGPSPDWVVGISGVDLCTDDCSWKESLDFDLYPWDAGTDSGITYMSPNSETQPPERMYRITTMYPEDPRAPFYNPQSREMTPLAKLHLRREKIVSRNCDDEFLQALQLEVSDDAEEQDTRAECRVTDYSTWSPCSVTCGKGIRMRSRQYVYPQQAEQTKCSRQLVSKEMCVAAVAECAEGSSPSRDRDEDEGENLANSQSLVNDNGEGAGLCKTSPWSVWSECSASCGIGITMRTRTFVNHLGRKRCPHITIVEKNKCMRPDCTYEQVELPDPTCPTTQWSDWSPCSATCGRGVTIRTRLLLLENGPEKENCTQRMELHQQKECVNPQDCHINMELAKDICVQQPDSGPCRGSYQRYAFNPHTHRCDAFSYGGCRGNRNNFLTENDCLHTCSMTGSASSTADQDGNLPKGCIMSEWENWSACSVSCGVGFSEGHRFVISEPKHGGQSCPKRLVKHRRCTMPAC
ncbi:spondin-1 [Drosophila pseudoobscura]|uniref:Spondin-1 n=1 Tax=Drosophila pseudoobscura pseudoobscura TaxID=46245 RepID=A0A6I8UTK7_DROPS|nr:spondin-1 [Drosophila pseudoobscura]